MLQGGNHPSLKLEWYEDLLRDLKARYPNFNLHAFSAAEIWHFHKLNKLPLPTVLERLKAAGMGSLPGTVIAALLLGIVESITSTFYGPSCAPAVAFGFLLLTLAVRPSGIMGR